MEIKTLLETLTAITTLITLLVTLATLFYLRKSIKLQYENPEIIVIVTSHEKNPHLMMLKAINVGTAPAIDIKFSLNKSIDLIPINTFIDKGIKFLAPNENRSCIWNGFQKIHSSGNTSVDVEISWKDKSKNKYKSIINLEIDSFIGESDVLPSLVEIHNELKKIAKALEQMVPKNNNDGEYIGQIES